MKEKEIEKFLRLWGLSPLVGRASKTWSPSGEVKKACNEWINKFPEPNHLGIGIIGSDTCHPDVLIYQILSELLSMDLILVNAHFINLSNIIIKMGSFEDKNVLINDARRNIQDADLIIFSDLGISSMPADSKNLVYSLIHRRTEIDKPFILSIPGGAESLSDMGVAFMSLINLSCKVVRIS